MQSTLIWALAGMCVGEQNGVWAVKSSTCKAPRSGLQRVCVCSGALDSPPAVLSTCKKSCDHKSRDFLQVDLLTAVPPFCPLTHIPYRAQIGVGFFFASGGLDSRHANLSTCTDPSRAQIGVFASGRLDSPPAISSDIVYHVIQIIM